MARWISMTVIAVTTSGRRAVAGLCLGGAVAMLSGCGGEPATAPTEVVTVTVTPTVTVKVAPRPTAVATRARTAKSDVVGRKFDLGTIRRVENDNGVPVIILDRWTARRVSDSRLASEGVEIRVHSDQPYQNLNSEVTYRVPVAQGAVFTYRHCVDSDQPPVKKSSTLEDFARLQDPEKVILLTLDPKGQAYRAQNDPAC